jgi:hypothetical protein
VTERATRLPAWRPQNPKGHQHDEDRKHVPPPDASVYAVKKTGGDKSLWTEIGAARAHQDGKGFNLKLDFLPIARAEIVIRDPRAEGGR